MTKETQIEHSLISKLTKLKYSHRPDIRNRDDLERNFREKFEALKPGPFIACGVRGGFAFGRAGYG